MIIEIEPIGFVQNNRQHLGDDYWGHITSTIVLADWLETEALVGLENFSHAEIIFFFHQAETQNIAQGARHPRNNLEWPKVGIFAQRAKNRPNRLGLTTVKIKECSDRRLTVEGLDAVDGTPILDIKPVMAEFLPCGVIRQPEWSRELMQSYWLPFTKNSV